MLRKLRNKQKAQITYYQSIIQKCLFSNVKRAKAGMMPAKHLVQKEKIVV
ncbi:MAG: hypothetical protein Q4F85_02050 [Prevotella sp.]|nr:hypothetical protein [Prevotella sp.]